MSFRENFDWQAQHTPMVIDIIGALPVSLFTAAKVAPRHVDLKRNGDLVMIPFGGMNIAQRLRRPHKGYFYAYGLDFTIRTRLESGAETEMSKIMRGLGDWFFYGHMERGWVDD